METETVGRVLTGAKIENLRDLWSAEQGLIPTDKARSIEVTDALVDSGATLLSVPTSMIGTLGLRQSGTKRIRSSLGVGEARMFEAVQLTIQGRDCTMDVLEVSDGTPVLIGQLPLEHLDFVIDMKAHKLIGNPAHGGEHIYELY
jgi:predicted aspartyl protease